MAFSTLACLLLGLGLAGQEQIIDAFDYSDALAAPAVACSCRAR